MPKPDLRYAYQGALASAIGQANGLTDAEWQDLARETTAIAVRIDQKREETPWRDLPTNKALSQVDAVLKSVEEKRDRFDDLVVLGIGGSALGLTALKTALCPPYWNLLAPRARGGRPRLWVMDNVDPGEFAAMTDLIDPKRTLFNVISKSGETAETMSQFLVALDLVKRCAGKAWKDHFVITTDQAKGILRPMVEKENRRRKGRTPDRMLESFVVPDGVGGRFSVLSPVGLFGAAMIGVNVTDLLAGAAAMDEACKSDDFTVNLAAQGAAVQIGLYRKGKPMSVMMPYSAALKDVADWYRQLWAESLGKICQGGAFVGPTPIKALGVTDQHSQVQLYREGPADKVFTILAAEAFENPVPLPDAPPSLKGLEHLKGQTLGKLLKDEERATVWALTAVSQRPVVQIILPRITPRAVGALLYLLQVQTAIAGEMLGINPFDQPGVEAAKQATLALLGQTGKIPGGKGLPAQFTTYEGLAQAIRKGAV